jgi:DNA-binding response OmpR family regulator
MAQQLPDLVILDLMLPKVDGWAITRWLRDRSDVPIIMLTARREEADRIAGLEMGADDYVVKPFSPQELVSRVRAVLRRTRQNESDAERPLDFAGLRIDPQTRLVNRRGLEISLTAKEFDMLWLLARHPRQVFTRDQLLERIWGLSDYIDPGTVTVHVRRLREKIEFDPSKPAHILTVWGVGYKFEP